MSEELAVLKANSLENFSISNIFISEDRKGADMMLYIRGFFNVQTWRGANAPPSSQNYPLVNEVLLQKLFHFTTSITIELKKLLLTKSIVVQVVMLSGKYDFSCIKKMQQNFQSSLSLTASMILDFKSKVN